MQSSSRRLENAQAQPQVGTDDARDFRAAAIFFDERAEARADRDHNKVVTLGGAYLYNMLYFYDPDFPELFKVKAEMRPAVAADGAAAAHYAARVGALARKEESTAVRRKRAGEDCRVRDADGGRPLARARDARANRRLARESAYFARIEGAQRVTAAYVERRSPNGCCG